MMSSALFAPDGMRVSGRVAEAGETRVLMEVVVAHEREDDGLVHHHAWAVGGHSAGCRTPSGRCFAGAGRSLTEVVLPGDHDDGLVHGHSWAVRTR